MKHNLSARMHSCVEAAILVGFLLALAPPATAQDRHGSVEQEQAVAFDVSPPLRHLPHPPRRVEKREIFLGRHLRPAEAPQPDPALQKSPTPSTLAPTAVKSILGVGQGFIGPQGTFSVNAAPSDANVTVGDTQVVQWVNESFAVFDKTTGAVTYGPVPGNTLWAGLGGGCEKNNDGDPIVQYDKLAKRWVMTQFSVSTTPYLQCVAVSTTSDATGTYNRYAFPQPNFPDYPKLGVWPDAYYITFNMFGSIFFVGPRVCALDRNAMLLGNPAATQQCVQLSSTYNSLLPADLDGITQPPSGEPNPLLALGSNALRLWQFHVDFSNSANSKLTGPTTISVAAFTRACSGGVCIPQSGTNQRLDSLADRLMYRLAYRYFASGFPSGSYGALVVNHSVNPGNGAASGIRWYELRRVNGGAWSRYQQGTYAPNSTSRWMGSIAMDKVGNIAVGYSVSSSSIHPGIRYTGRAPTDTLGTLQAETSIIEGAGSQLRNLSRWGDYTSLSVDPGDDCTMWYTNQYLINNGTFNWSTRIGSFKFSSCNK